MRWVLNLGAFTSLFQQMPSRAPVQKRTHQPKHQTLGVLAFCANNWVEFLIGLKFFTPAKNGINLCGCGDLRP
jgi:hypothetical protein